MVRWNATAVVAEGARWERWTIDEILDDHVRLLACVTRLDVTDEYVALLLGLAGSDSTPQNTAYLTAAAVTIELGAADDTWHEETAVIVDERELAKVLRRRASRGGLPGRRDLREGDVFWIIVPPETPSISATPNPRRDAFWFGEEPLMPTDSLAQYARAGAVVLDLTAAARQAVKRIYHRAATGARELEAGRG